VGVDIALMPEQKTMGLEVVQSRMASEKLLAALLSSLKAISVETVQAMASPVVRRNASACCLKKYLHARQMLTSCGRVEYADFDMKNKKDEDRVGEGEEGGGEDRDVNIEDDD